MALALILVGAYLLGSIPIGYLVAKARGIDIRKVGSGNIGATNVHRALGKKGSIPVFVLDVLKGLIPALVAGYVLKDQTLAFAAGLAAVIGHCSSPFLGFKGGKGIATGLGMMLGSSPWVALSAFGVFLVFMVFTRFVSLSSIAAALAVIPLAIAFGDPPILLGAYVLLVAFIIFKHRANIGRLRTGTEPKFSFGEPAVPVGAKVEEPEGNPPSMYLSVLLALTSAAVITSSFIRLG